MHLNILNIYLVIHSHVFALTRAELFTALSDLEPLLDSHKRIVDDLDYFVEKEEKRLQVLDKQLNIYKTEHWKAMEDISNYLGKPLNDFTLIKSLTTDLAHIEDNIRDTSEYEKNITLLHADVKYPTLEDLTGAAQALARLQDVYDLSVRDLSEGKINGVVHSTPMSAGDCYELGRALYNEKDFRHALAWMEQALRKLRDSDDPRPLNEADILEYISFSHYMLEDTRSALEWTKKLLEAAPKHHRARGNILHYQKILAKEKAKVKNHQLQNAGEEKGEQKSHEKPSSCAETNKKYQSLCRDNMDFPVGMNKRLHCRYLRGHHPFLQLAPIKMELVYWQPDVVLFHDVISDNEIRVIQELAKPKLQRAGFKDPKTGKLIPAKYIISKWSRVGDGESPVVARVSQRVSDMTGLSVLTAEDLYVSNYGIGGHYEPHLDYYPVNVSKEQSHGNRIASLMFYMSDVDEGGATVFTELGVSVSPVKGAALFWMNLHPSGEGDLATRHAGCPVLRGEKWVAIKWIRQVGQELLKPCSLQYQPGSFT